MTPEELFGMALGLSRPWKVESSVIEGGELRIRIGFEKGAKFEGLPVHDTVDRSWRHLNFWQYATVLTARVPRVKGKDGKVTQVEVPWARPGSGFTALFEAVALTMMRSCPVCETARILGVDDMALWRLLERSVSRARAGSDHSWVRRVAVDETSCRRGQDYISVFVDQDARRVLFACRGHAASSIEAFKKDLIEHGGDPARIEAFSCDMGPSFLSGISKHFPQSQVVLDKFHLVKMLSEAVERTRKEDTRLQRSSKGSRFLWLKNPSRLSERERRELGRLRQEPAFAKTAEAYRLRLAFQEVFSVESRSAERALDAWFDAALDCGVVAVERVAESFLKAKDKILSWFQNRISNGVLEGLNSVLQSAKRRARGYANPNHMILVSYLMHGKLPLSEPHQTRHPSTAITHSM